MGDKSQTKILKHHAQVNGGKLRRESRLKQKQEANNAFRAAIRLQVDYYRLAIVGFQLAWLTLGAVAITTGLLLSIKYGWWG